MNLSEKTNIIDAEIALYDLDNGLPEENKKKA